MFAFLNYFPPGFVPSACLTGVGARMASHPSPKGILYDGLARKTAEIRLVSLQPGAWSDDISCSLFKVHLGGRPIPFYRALSYAWGLPSPTSPCISINGHKIQVTSNLEVALRCLRHELKPVVLWVDAIVGDLEP